MSTNEWPRVHEIKCENAESFIEAISDIKQQLIIYGEEKNLKLPHINRNDFIYRGHADSDWELIPSALRKDMRKLLEYLWKYDIVKEVSSPEARKLVITEFIKVSDERGLNIPGLNNSLKMRVLNYGELPHEGIVPGSDFVHRMALAQHYGIPTEMLDWSKQPLIAAYFAASKALEMMTDNIEKSAKCIALWILNTNIHNYQNKEGAVSGDFTLQVHDVPRNGNSNLIAQHGLFTTWKYYKCDEDGNELGLESDAYDSIPHKLPMLIKVIMPSTHIISLLEYLEEKNITAAEIFPGYGGVAKNVMEKVFMYKLDHLMKQSSKSS